MSGKSSPTSAEGSLEQRFCVMGANVLRGNICARFNICASYEQ